MTPTRPPKTWPALADALLELIAASGKSYPELEKATGLHRASIMRFAQGERTLRLDRADALARYFGLRIVEAPPKPRRASTKRRASKPNRKKGG
jgi:transcriptional regulator with XRE-family HTH domain